MVNPTAAQRRMFAKMGVAMSDGSYYIRPDHPEDLQNAIDSVGRAAGSGGTSDEEQRNAVRRHIIKRAKATNRADKIPDTWNPDGTLKAVKHDDIDANPAVDEFLAHFGVKGMHWGVRKDRGSSSSSATPRAKSSTDAARAEKLTAKAKSGTHTLTNKELQDLVTRMNLEQQLGRLTTTPQGKSGVSKGRDFVENQTKTARIGINAYKTGKEVAKILGPLLVAAAAGAAASKAGGSSGPIRMPQLAITSG